MGDTKQDQETAADQAGETRLRGRTLSKNQLDNPKQQKTDQVIRTDSEKDSLYDDALDLDDDSGPLTGVNGADDSPRERE